MSDAPVSNPHTRALLRGGLATLGLFVAHHVYGAVRYNTPWRHHAAFVAFWVGLALVAAFLVYRRHPHMPRGRFAGWTLAALSLLFLVLQIGLYEGLYNHVLKDALFLAGAPRELLLRMFPPPTYELPNDVWFELSGVLQVLPALYTGRVWLRFLRVLRGEASRPSETRFLEGLTEVSKQPRTPSAPAHAER
ncbi:hypothetical protein [Vitiosangium sp. GDMCC 1.1324]|uniref:hypothetical protein n=1 Tax=Vitiosangium sp. (strain GDMCC 1.1324) TaxID=2138576 RepID=UPI000D358198|nr:hypothetical protein [Vitiosangium sp. GDMCC 1.1324]PTL79697.1 hypothetical protein DAT35_33390 [Vitiosangium sp. GDMCC 1.1324]